MQRAQPEPLALGCSEGALPAIVTDCAAVWSVMRTLFRDLLGSLTTAAPSGPT